VLCLRQNPTAQPYVARLASKHGKPKALTILAHKLARAVYYMLRRAQAFDATKCFPRTAPREVPSHAEGKGVALLGREVTPEPPLDTAVTNPMMLDGHEASRSGPTGHDREGGRYLDTPRKRATRLAHSRRGTGRATPKARPRRRTARERVR
jgi:hypothetical protein